MDMVIKAADLERLRQELVSAAAAVTALNGFASKLIQRLKDEGTPINAEEGSAWMDVQARVAEASSQASGLPENRSEVRVEHWNSPCYGGSEEERSGITFPVEVVDMRAGSGQLLVSVGMDNGSVDDVLAVAFEVTCCLGSKAGAPCASLYEGDEQLVRLFKHPNGILVEPMKPGVQVLQSKLANGDLGWMVIGP